jgi:hypothetical protein
MKKLSRIEIAGILALCGDIHLVGSEDDIHFYKVPVYHEGDVEEVHRVHCSARENFDYNPIYVTFEEAVEEIAASACYKYYNPRAIWYGGNPMEWEEFILKT